jgi:bifunctional isochorismate lyase / aryl carrier protein
MGKRATAYLTPANLEEQTARWLRKIRASVAPRPQLVLDPDRCGLLVVDLLRYFVDPRGRCFLPAAPAIVPSIRRLVDAWHGRGAPVFFTRHSHAGPDDLGMLGRFFRDYIRLGEPDAEIVEGIVPGTGDPVLRKTTYDAFLGTSLEAELRSRGLEQVLVTGVLTHLCCETTARAAFCRGFEVYLAVDALATSDEQLHLGSLRALADGVAVTMSTREILERCDGKK